MRFIYPPIFSRDKPSIIGNFLILANDERIDIKKIKKIEVQPSWVIFYGIVNEITLTLQDSTKNLYNVTGEDAKKLIDLLKKSNNPATVIKRPFLYGRRLFLPDFLLPKIIPYLIIGLAISLLLILLLALR